MSTATDLLAAAVYIDEHGWTQHDYVSAGGQVCLVGALQAVTDGTTDRPERLLAAKAWLLQHLGEPVIGWNDTQGRTQDEAVAALRNAAEQVPA